MSLKPVIIHRYRASKSNYKTTILKHFLVIFRLSENSLCCSAILQIATKVTSSYYTKLFSKGLIRNLISRVGLKEGINPFSDVSGHVVNAVGAGITRIPSHGAGTSRMQSDVGAPQFGGISPGPLPFP